METAANLVIGKLYAATLNLLRLKVIDSIEDGDVALTELRSQLTNEFEEIKAKLNRLLDEPLKSAFAHLQSALNYAAHNKHDDAKHYFRLCQAKSVEAFSTSESFHDKCNATRLRIMCTLYLNDYFTGTGSIGLMRQECKDALDRLFREPEVTSAIRDQFESIWFSSVSKKTRMKVFVEVSDLMSTVGEYVGADCTQLSGKNGTKIMLSNIPSAAMKGHSRPVTSLAISGGRLYSGSDDKTIKVWDLNTLSWVATLSSHTDTVRSLAFSGDRLYSGSDDMTIKVWDLNTLSCVAILADHTGTVRSLAISGDRLYSGSGDKTIKVWDLSTLSCVATLTGHTAWVISFVISGGRLYSGSDDKTIKVWDLNTLTCVTILADHTGTVRSLAISGDRLYSGSYDKTIKVWDLNTLDCVATLTEHTGDLTCLAISGGRLYSGAEDKTIKVWDLNTLTCTRTDHTWFVTSLVVSGGRLFSGGLNLMVSFA